MGIFDGISARLFGRGTTSTPSGTHGDGTRGVSSPWTDQTALEAFVWGEFLDGVHEPVTRAEAMALPGIARSRHILTVDASRSPLRVLDAADQVMEDDTTAWLQREGMGVSWQHRAVWTVDDLIHYGWSLWLVDRVAPEPGATIRQAVRAPFHRWKFGEGAQAGQVLVDDQPVPAHVAILIPGFHDGIVATHPRTIRASRELEVAWSQRAAQPIPAMELHQTTPDTLTNTERDALVAHWIAKLQANGGGVAYTPMSIEARPHGQAAQDLLIQGRNAAAVDQARIVGVPAAMVDASNVNASLAYETLEGRGGEYLDRSLPLYLGAIDARLSLDDVTPAGTRVRADVSALSTTQPATTGTPTED